MNETNKEDLLEKSDVFLNLAHANQVKGNYSKSLLNCKKALELISSDSSEQIKIAQIFSSLANTYNNLGKYDSALFYGNKALTIQIKLLKDKKIDISSTYSILGTTYIKKAGFDKALYFYQKALDINIEDYKGQRPEIAGIYLSIGLIFENKAEYDTALYYYKKALQSLDSITGERRSALRPLCLENIGFIFFSKGDYDQALIYYRKAIQMYTLLFGETEIKLANCYNSIGTLYLNSGEYDKALEYFTKALNIKLLVLGDHHPDVSQSYNNIGIVYKIKKEYNKALDYYQKALDLQIPIGEFNPKVAGYYNNIGSVLLSEGEYDKALEYFQKSVQIRIRIFGKLHKFLASNYTNIGICYEEKKDYKTALEYLLESLQINLSVYGKCHAEVAKCYNNIGALNFKKCDYFNALRYYQLALTANVIDFKDTALYRNPESVNILSKPIMLEILDGKANAFYELYKSTNMDGDLRAAIETDELNLNLINKMRNEYNIENTKLLLSENTKNYYSGAVHVAIEYDKLHQLKNSDKKAFKFIENGKSATLTAKFNESNATRFAGIPDSLIEIEKEYANNINLYETEIVREKYQKGKYDTVKVNLYEGKNFNYSRKLDSLISYFEIYYPNYYKVKYDNHIATISDIQDVIDKNSALIDYLAGDSSLYISVITDSVYKIEEIKIDSSFKKMVIEYFKGIKTAEPGLFLKNSPKLYEKLIKPVQRIIANKQHLIIIPDDYLYYVPFETLTGNTHVQNEDYTKLTYLIKSHSISYHHSATLWYNSQRKDNNQDAKQMINFIGFAPVFSKERNNGTILSSNMNIIDTTGNNLAYRSISMNMKRFNPLPYSKDEVTSIVKLFEKHGKEAKAYLYAEASESNFKAEAGTYKIIHIASHGFSNDKEPDLSGIVFSQPTDTFTKDDGILYTGETYNLKLNSDLIVLSSCESGLGKLIKGEGLQALSRGFLYAGTPNVAFSLWKALDEPTMNLMIKFYSNMLDGENYPEALRQAKLTLIKNPATAFPHFWGGFVLVGR